MDQTNTNVTDDQELANVLESMNQIATAGAPTVPQSDDTVAETTDAVVADAPTQEDAPAAPDQPIADTLPEGASYTLDPTPVAAPVETPLAPAMAAESPELEAIKKDALEELRPLVDKLNIPADEKFDTLLLIIRSTDDKSLVGAAHEAARAIEDETKRAQALLDVIKEIDYFSGHGQNPA